MSFCFSTSTDNERISSPIERPHRSLPGITSDSDALDERYGNFFIEQKQLSSKDSYDRGSLTMDRFDKQDKPDKLDKSDSSKSQIIKRRTLDSAILFGMSRTTLDSNDVTKTSNDVSLSSDSTSSFISDSLKKSIRISDMMNSPFINVKGDKRSGSVKSKNEEKERVKEVNDESLDDWIDQIEKNCDFSKPVKDMEKEIDTPQTLEDLMDEIEQEYDATNAYNNKEKRLHGSSKTLSFSDENLFRLESEILNYYG